jgi:3-deoxy-D-arabino-heptulosonate 7-phosphate (DAHP) synthase
MHSIKKADNNKRGKMFLNNIELLRLFSISSDAVTLNRKPLNAIPYFLKKTERIKRQRNNQEVLCRIKISKKIN